MRCRWIRYAARKRSKSKRARGIRSAGSKGTRLETSSGAEEEREGLGADPVVLDEGCIVTSDETIVGKGGEDEEPIVPSGEELVADGEKTMALDIVEDKVERRFDVAGIGMTIVGIGSVLDPADMLSPEPILDSVEGAVEVTGELRPP